MALNDGFEIKVGTIPQGEFSRLSASYASPTIRRVFNDIDTGSGFAGSLSGKHDCKRGGWTVCVGSRGEDVEGRGGVRGQDGSVSGGAVESSVFLP
jgi:uncharacterized protein with beta-barrel porin domain